MLLLGGGVTLKWWGLLEGSEVTGDMLLKGYWDLGPFSSLCFPAAMR
jgi:hypothetical protein